MLTVTVSTEVPANRYFWFDGGKVPIDTTAGPFRDFQIPQGINTFHTSYEATNGCPSDTTMFTIEGVALPGTPAIEGLSSVCVGDTVQVYRTETAADTYQWAIVPRTGRIEGPATLDSVAVVWDPGAGASAGVSLTVANLSGTGRLTCPAQPVSLPVLVRDDVTFFELSGENMACNGELGTLALSGSQPDSTYVLFIDGERSQDPADAMAGTGGILTWTGLETGREYTVFLETQDCGSFQMNGSLSIGELPVPQAPAVENMPLEACDGDMLTVTVSTEVPANRYFWFDAMTVPIDTTAGPFRAFQIPQGINTFHTSYEDTNGCPSDTTMFTIEGVALPGTPAIEGLSSVCVGDTVQVYRTETAADTYQWAIVPGTGRIEGPATLDSVTIIWGPGAGASAGVSLTVANLSGTGRLTCPAQPVSLPVLVRDDVTFFELSGENMACNGELGTLALSGSQPDSTYVLFIDGQRSQDPADAMAGTGGILTWTGLETGREYTVFLETQDCGSFPMNGSLSIGELPVPQAPAVENMPLEACDGDMLTVTVSTEVPANRYFWFDAMTVPIDTTAGPFRAFQIPQGINTFHTSYEDTNGCPSDTTMFTIEGVALPGTPAIEGLSSVCVGDTVQVYRTETAADTYQWAIVPGTGRIEGPATLDSVTIIWGPGAGASAGVSLTVANLSGTGRLTCPAQPVSLPVLVRDDVTFFELSGENMACNGELGTLALSGSQPDSTYVLFIDGQRSQDPADAMAGNGGILTWTGLETGREYTVFLETQDCGSFQMNGSLSIGELPVPQAPAVENMPLEACDGDMLTVTVSTEVPANRYFWFDAMTVPIDTTAGPFRAFQIPQGINTFHTSYEDTNGCPSDTTMFTIEGVALPGTPAIEGLSSVCVGDTAQVYRTETAADTYQWAIVPGTGRIEGPATLDSVTIIWGPGAGASAGVSLTVANLSGTGALECEVVSGPFPVVVRDDVGFFNVEDGNFSCASNTGSIRLSDSQPDSTYVLTIQGEVSTNPMHTVKGTGGPIAWSSLPPGFVYSVLLRTGDCYDYPMIGEVDLQDGSGRLFPGNQLIDIMSSTEQVSSGDVVQFEALGENGTVANYRWDFTGEISSIEEMPYVVFNLPDTAIDVWLELEYVPNCTETYSFERVLEVVDDNGLFDFLSDEDPFSIEVTSNATTISLFPSPANEMATISFTSIAQEQVNVRIIGLNGDELQTNSFPVETGEISRDISLIGLSSGPYILILEAPQFPQPIFITGLKI